MVRDKVLDKVKFSAFRNSLYGIRKEPVGMIINVSEAKTHLSRYIDMVYHGEEVVIAKNNLPLVDLVVHKVKGKRSLGRLKGKFSVPDSFFEEDQEITAMFYGSDGDDQK
jgi:antitoxin (DNA-binding transcriptional repressor) of toxin-antitoxin stability system